MPRLAGLSAAEVIRKLRKAGFVFDRQAKGSHEIWWNPRTRARTTVPNHPGDLPKGRYVPSSSRLDYRWRSSWNCSSIRQPVLARPGC